MYKIDKKDILYNTGNYIHYFVIAFIGVQPIKIPNHYVCCTPETNIIL